MLETPASADRPMTSAIPVARPARLRGQDETEADEPPPPEAPIVQPSAVKGWASSLVLHALLLLLFALWVFTPTRNEAKSFDTRIGGEAGSGGGGEPGSLAGMEGIDQPLTLEPPHNFDEQPLSSLSPAEVALDPSAAHKVAAAKNANAGGVNLANPGGGGQGEGFGLAKFGKGTELIGGVGVKVGDPQFTLIWDSRADIDLHVVEPGGAEIYWEKPHGDKGGELDVDDIDGFGPENIYWVQGEGPPGEYRWFVHYYGGLGGVNVPTHWKVRLKHNGQVTVFTGKLNFIGAKSKVHTLTVDREAGAQSNGGVQGAEVSR